jgi:hypothetical protein
MEEELKFLKAAVDFDILLAATREAVELYFEGDGIPVKYDVPESTKGMSTMKKVHEITVYNTGLKYTNILNYIQYLLLLLWREKSNQLHL